MEFHTHCENSRLIFLTSLLCSFSRTYPKAYRGIGRIERYSHSPFTNGNGTVKCVDLRTVLTNPFLLHEDVSNGLELSAFVDRNIDRHCSAVEVSPPNVLVRVSSLTATTTNYVNTPEIRTSAAKKASPSIPLSTPTAPQTSSPKLSNRPVTVPNSLSRDTADPPSVATKSTPAEPKPLDSGDSASPPATPLASETPTSTQSGDVGSLNRSWPSAPLKSEEPQPTLPTSMIPSSQIFDAAQSLQSLVIADSTITYSKHEPSRDPRSSAPSVANDITMSLGSLNIVVGTRTIPIAPNSPSSVFLIAGQSFTAKPTGFFIDGTDLLPNGPAVTVSGTLVSLGASGTIIGTRTVPSPSNSPSFSVFSAGGQTFTANPTGFPIDGTSILPNGPAVTIAGTPVSLDASGIVIGTKTITLPSVSLLPFLKVAGTTFTANPTGFLLGSATISPNGAPVTISGTLISLGSSDIVIGTSTIDLFAEPSVLSVAGQDLTLNPSGFSINGTEIHRGGSPVTISGIPISLGSSTIRVGSSTVPLASMTNGLGPAILSGLGFTASPSRMARASAGNGSEPFVGAQIKMDVQMKLLALFAGLIGLILA